MKIDCVPCAHIKIQPHAAANNNNNNNYTNTETISSVEEDRK